MARDPDEPKYYLPQRRYRKNPYKKGEDKAKPEQTEEIRIGNAPTKKDKRAQDIQQRQAAEKQKGGGKHSKDGCASVFLIGAAGLTALEEVIRWLA